MVRMRWGLTPREGLELKVAITEVGVVVLGTGGISEMSGVQGAVARALL